jgi:hypothetical protein
MHGIDEYETLKERGLSLYGRIILKPILGRDG